MYLVVSPAAVLFIKSTSSASLRAFSSAAFGDSDTLELIKPVPTSSIGATNFLRATAPAPLARLMSGAATISNPKFNRPEVSAPIPLLVSPKVVNPGTLEAALTTSLPKL